MKKIGFIGAGNMATGLISGIIASNMLPAKDIIINDTMTEKVDFLVKKYGVTSAKTNNELIAAADIIIMAFKPQAALSSITSFEVNDNKKLFVSILTGLTSASLKKAFKDDVRLVRVMPNTPALVGAGITSICNNKDVPAADMDIVKKIFESVGKVYFIDEEHVDAVSAISSCGPAYFFMIFDALADAGVKAGLPKRFAAELAAYTAAGSAKMLIETGEHPAQLKDNVSSPAGSTIEAIKVLENYALRAAFIDAVEAAVEKNKVISEEFDERL